MIRYCPHNWRARSSSTLDLWCYCDACGEWCWAPWGRRR